MHSLQTSEFTETIFLMQPLQIAPKPKRQTLSAVWKGTHVTGRIKLYTKWTSPIGEYKKLVKNDFLVLKFGTIGLSPAQPAHRLPIGQSLKIQAQFLQPGTSLLVQRCTYCNGFLSMQMGKRGRDLIFSNSCNFRCLLLASLQARQYHLRWPKGSFCVLFTQISLR